MNTSARVGLLLLAGTLAFACAEEAEDLTVASAFDVKLGALASCSAANGQPFSEISQVQVVVHPGESETPGATSYDSFIGIGSSGAALAEDVPEGSDEQVTILGHTGGAVPGYWARRKHVVVNRGADNPLSLLLSRFGGYSCPKGQNDFTHRLFSTVTPLGGQYFLLAGGFTTVNTTGTTRYEVSDSSRKAFIYDSEAGSISLVQSQMRIPRGGHSAVLVRGTSKNRVVMFGGAKALTWNPANQNGFAWAYETTDGEPTVEVFEYDVGGDPLQGSFLEITETMPVKRVFPSANTIGTDRLVLVCGGGRWGTDDKDPAYRECDVWDGEENQFLKDPATGVSLSNNFMDQYRAGHNAVAFEEGQVTRLLFVGGVTEGPIAEIYTSSTGQVDGVGGSFVDASVDGPPHSFFQSLTKVGDRRFIMLGGVGWDGTKFSGTSKAYAWQLEVVDDGGALRLQAEQIAGLGAAPYFHTAAAPAGDRFVVLGGFTDNDLNTSPDVRHWDPGVGLVSPPATEQPFLGRAGMASILLDNDTVLLVGGISGVDDLKSDQAGALEVYTPSNLLPFVRN